MPRNRHGNNRTTEPGYGNPGRREADGAITDNQDDQGGHQFNERGVHVG